MEGDFDTFLTQIKRGGTKELDILWIPSKNSRMPDHAQRLPGIVTWFACPKRLYFTPENKSKAQHVI